MREAVRVVLWAHHKYQHSLFEGAKDLGNLLALHPMHMLPLQKPLPAVLGCQQTCGVFVTGSALLSMCGVLCIAAHVEWRAHREFLQEHGRSSHLGCKPSIVVALQHCWLLAMCA